MNKKVLAAILPLFGFFWAGAQARITVDVTNFSNNKGSCVICLYNSEAEFHDKGTPLECKTVPVANKNAATQFTGMPAGNYAILVIHDANNNRKLDTNFMGIPKEGYGASGNKLPFAAAPKFKDNKFILTEGGAAQANIRLRYIF